MLAATAAALSLEVVVVGFPLPAQLPQLLQLAALEVMVLHPRFQELPQCTVAAVVAVGAIQAGLLERVAVEQVAAGQTAPTQLQTQEVAAVVVAL